MKIAFIVPHLADGGMPKLVATMADAWKNSHHVTVVLLIAGMERNYQVSCDVVELAPLGKNVPGKALSVLQRIIRARKLRRREKFDEVISFGSAANAVNVLSRAGEKIILTEHNIKSQENKSWGIAGKFYDAAIRFLYNRADSVVAISRAMKRDLETHYGVKNAVLIHNPHNLEEISAKARLALPAALSYLEKARYIVAAGPTDERKGFLHLVRAFSEMKKRIPDLKLVIAGREGALHAEILRQSGKLGLEEDLVITGYLSNPYPVMARASLFACSSLREGLPNVIIESLALGVPVVSTDCISGPREIMQLQTSDDGTAVNDEMVDCGALVPVFASGSCEEALSHEELLFAKASCDLLLDGGMYRQAKKNCLARSLDFASGSIMARYESLLVTEKN